MREFPTPADWERIFGGKSDKKSDRKERQRDQRRPDPEDAAEIAESGVEGATVTRAVLADLRGKVRREEEAPIDRARSPVHRPWCDPLGPGARPGRGDRLPDGPVTPTFIPWQGVLGSQASLQRPSGLVDNNRRRAATTLFGFCDRETEK